ncbi:stalk domain-containing protein [Paenibacillus sanguinis]|uniref:stalk domain-containing protein n=1 Tax=Paenibacillus sanguinis TaxID=225906 RepID=UPI000381E484|nr:stalk domain-containing protein [Paenibacillus sanguinis]
MIKKSVLLVFIAMVMAIGAMPLTASAFLGKTDVVVDGKPLIVSAVSKRSITFVPFRKIFDELGLAVAYDAKAKTVTGTKAGLKVSFTLGSKSAYINGQKKGLQAAPFAENGSVYVPLRIVGEATGAKVYYLQDLQIVLIHTSEFNGLDYSGEYGNLVLTKDGALTADNALVLKSFLEFSQEENIVFIKDISNTPEEDMSFITLTPDTVIPEPEPSRPKWDIHGNHPQE